MKNNKLNYLVVGTFVIAIVVGLIVTVANLSGRTGATDDYHAIYENVTGIEFGTQVLYEGFPIGQVESVSPFEDKGRIKFRVEMSVREGWKIPTDSVAKVVSSGLLAAVTIGIDAGDKVDALQPGSLIPSEEAADVLTAMSDLARDISELTETDIKPLMANLTKAAGGVGELLDKKGGELIEDIQDLMGTMTEQAPEIVENINLFSEKINKSADQLSRMLSQENLEAIDTILAEMQTSTNNLTKLTTELVDTREAVDKLLGNLDDISGRVGNLVTDNQLDVDRSIVDLRHTVETVARHITAINQNLEGASRNMYEFTRQIRQNPGLLIGGSAQPDNAAK